MKKGLILLGVLLLAAVVVQAQSVIQSVNSGAVSNNDLRYSVGEIFVLPVTSADDANSGLMGILYRTQLLTVGVPENVAGHWNVYPNPATNLLTLDMTSVANITEGTIYNLQGQLVATTAIENNQIDISQLDSGYYILHIHHSKPVRFIKL